MVVDIILGSIKHKFIRNVVEQEANKVNTELQKYIQEGFIVKSNESYRVNWNKAEITWEDMEYENKYNEYKRLREKCGKADALLYSRI